MSEKIYIIDTSTISAGGNNINELWSNLIAGKSAVKNIKRFSTEKIDFHKAACIEGIEENEYNNKVCEITSRALKQIRKINFETYIIWAGIKGDAEYIEKKKDGKKTSEIFAASPYRKWVCDYLGVCNKGIEINAACASSTAGIAIAADMIKSGEHDNVIVAAGDIVSRFTHYGFSSLKALSPSECRPFDKNRDGLTLGDGASVFILANEKFAEKHNYTPIAELAGWSFTNDATHITAPAKDGCGLTDAIQKAAKMASLNPYEIEAFCAHGTGTVYNDAMELTAIENIFGARRFPVFSVKGAIGHTLGAAGAIEADVSIKCLLEKKVPPTINFNEPEERAIGRVSNVSQTFSGNNILTTNSGFGGVNSALIFKK